MVDRTRVLAKIDELDGYLRELDAVRPATREEYGSIERKRACERLLQISIETSVTICQLLVSGLRLGLPSEENDVFDKLVREQIISPELGKTLQTMKGFRNILVHEYGDVDDELVFTFLTTRTDDFTQFRREIIESLDRLSRAE